MLSGSDFLQGIIVLFVFVEIQGLGLGRYPLAGIIAECAAIVLGRGNPFLDAKNGVLVQIGTMGAEFTATVNFLGKQHSRYLICRIFLIIQQHGGDFYC